MKEFYRQYRKDEGKSIPFSDFGYANLEDFLQAEVGCSIRELNGDILISCQSAKSEHIKNLVSAIHFNPSVFVLLIQNNNKMKKIILINLVISIILSNLLD